MPATPEIRAARATDAEAIDRLLVDAALPLDGVRDMLARDPAQFFVAALRDEELCAIAALEMLGDVALLRSVAVAPAWRGTGLGRQIVQRAIDHAMERELHALYLLTTTAADWFPRFGFAVVDRKSVPASVSASVEFRSACPDTAIAMARTLRSSA